MNEPAPQFVDDQFDDTHLDAVPDIRRPSWAELKDPPPCGWGDYTYGCAAGSKP